MSLAQALTDCIEYALTQHCTAYVFADARGYYVARGTGSDWSPLAHFGIAYTTLLA